MAERIFDGEVRIKNKVDKDPVLSMYKKMMDYNKGMERSLSMQVMYSKMLKSNLQGLGGLAVKTPSPSAPSSKTKAVQDAHVLAMKNKRELASKEVKEQQMLSAAFDRRFNKEEKRRIDLIKLEDAKRGAAEDRLFKQKKQHAQNLQQTLSRLTAPTGADKAKAAASTFFTPEEIKQKPAKGGAQTAKMKAEFAAQEKLNKQYTQRRAAIKTINDELESSYLWNKKKLTVEEESTKRNIEQGIRQGTSLTQMRKMVRLEMQRLRTTQRITKEEQKQSFLLQRMQASSKQLAGNMVSAFAVTAGVGGAVKLGQDLESAQIAINAASGSAEMGAENMKFLRQEARRLGVDVVQGAKGLSQLLAAGEGVLPQEDLRNIFTGVTEASTVMGLSADDTSGAIRAIFQMMSKGKVSAEEMRQQLGERMSPAFKLMAKAVGVTTEELDRLMKRGEVFSKDVLPEFGRNLREFAAPGLEDALNSNRIAMNRMFNEVKFSGEDFFMGLEGGLTEFFNSVSTMFKSNEKVWKSLGKVLGSILKGVTFVLDHLVTPALNLVGATLDVVTTSLGDFSALIAPAFSPLTYILLPKLLSLLPKLSSGFTGIGSSLAGITGKFLKWAAAIEIIVGGLEELVNAFITKDKVGVLYDARRPDTSMLERFFGVDPDTVAGLGSVRKAGSYYSDILANPVWAKGASQETVIQNNVILDGEVVATSVTKSSAFDGAMNRHITMGQGGR